MANNRPEIEHEAAIERTRLAVSRYARAWLAGDRRGARRLLSRRLHAALFRPQPAGRRPRRQGRRTWHPGRGHTAHQSPAARHRRRHGRARTRCAAGPRAFRARRQDGRSRALAGVRRARRTAFRMLGLRPGPGAGRRLSYVKPVQTAFSIGLAFRAGIVIAATPTTTQASPIQAVELNCSPRKTTPTATPIGTRK